MEERQKSRYWGKQSQQYLTNICKKDNGELFALEWNLAGEHLRIPLVLPIDRNDVDEEQCTGKNDKNDKLIYEGDIVGGFIICFWGGNFRVCHNDGSFDQLEDGWDNAGLEELEITSNIHTEVTCRN